MPLTLTEDAKVVPRQPRRPCSDCPWRREALVGWLGGSSVREWLEAAHGEATIQCHALKGPKGPHYCAGAAIYRANVCKRARDPRALVLPPDRAAVFSSPAEFQTHHTGRQKK